MKKIIPLIVILVVAVGFFVYSINYRNKADEIEKNSFSSVQKAKDEDIEVSEKDLIAENKEGGYKLYFKNDVAILTHGETRVEFDSWSESIKTKAPELYYNDFDKDGQKELIIRLVDESNDLSGKTEYSYILYQFEPETDVNGKEKLQYTAAQASTWRNIFAKNVKFEVTQLKHNKKHIQFAMNDADKPLTYDRETGICKNKYVYYARCDSSKQRKYYTVSSCTKGLGNYSVGDDGKIYLDIQLIVKYEEVQKYYHIGYIRCEMYTHNGQFKITPNTIHIEPRKEYKITDPRIAPEETWKCTLTNTGVTTDTNTKISNIECVLDANKGDRRDINFSTFSSDINKVRAIDITESCVVFMAKDGYSFDESIYKNGNFRVYLDESKKTDISYVCELQNNKLAILFEKSFEKDELSNLTIEIGK